MDFTSIIAGVDGSEGGRRALRWAIDEALRTDGTVTAVITWQWDGIETSFSAATSPEAARQYALDVLDSEVKIVTGGYVTVPPIIRATVGGAPAVALIKAAKHASLLVLGSHGHSRLRHAVLGSVSEECVRHATCPIVVVPVP